MTHRLPGSILRDHLRRVGGAFARAFETDFAGARPSNHVSVHVGDRHDRVVKCRKNMRDAGVNVLAAFGFDDLRLLDVVALESERFSGAPQAGAASSLGLLAGFLRLRLAAGSALAAGCSGAAGAILAGLRVRRRSSPRFSRQPRPLSPSSAFGFFRTSGWSSSSGSAMIFTG